MELPRRAPDTGELWHLTMEHSPVGMALISPEGDILTANYALCEMFIYPQETVTSLTFVDIAHPDDLEGYDLLLQEFLSGQVDSFRGTKRYVRSDGSILVGDLSVALLRDEQGDPIHFIAQIVDLSENRAFQERLESAEEQIDAEQRRAEAIYDTVAVGLLLLDAEGVYQAYNTRHRDFMELAFPGGHLGQSGQDGFVYDADQSRLITREEMPTFKAASGEEFEDLLVWVGAEPETRRALSVSARSVRDRLGRYAGAALAYHDVTELMRAIKVKDEFVGSVSHELRTPLTAALANLELLDENEDLPAGVRSQISAARRNAMRLSHLVADLLFTAHGASGGTLVGHLRVDLATTVVEAVEAAQVHAAGADVSLHLDVPKTLKLVADGLRLRQVTDNLIANAIQYNHPGGEVRVSLSASADQVELVVADTGHGIEESDLIDIFGRFFRGQNARRLSIPGTGLGLNIVRTIVAAHGGEVTMESTVGVGTTVRVVLPR